MADSTRAREGTVPPWGADFLAALRELADERAAARQAGVTLKTARNWRTRDAAFRAEWDTARAEAQMPERIQRRDAMEWRAAFIARLRGTGTVRYAATAAGVSRQTVYEWRDRDPDFAREWDDAIADATEALEAAARARALSGSDKLLMFLLKAQRPDKYGDRLHIEHSIQKRKRQVYEDALREGLTQDEARQAVAEFERIVADATGSIGGIP